MNDLGWTANDGEQLFNLGWLQQQITGVITFPSGGSSSSAPDVVKTRRRTYPKEMPKVEQDDQDIIDLSCAVVAYLNHG